MGVINVRELLRDSKEVFDGVEAAGASYVIVRNGKPFAALVPIDQETAEEMMLASRPDIRESAREAEGARAEGRTRPLSQLLSEAGLDDLAAGELGASARASGLGEEFDLAKELDAFRADAGSIVGASRAEEAVAGVTRSLEDITRQTVSEVITSGGADERGFDPAEWALLASLNARLFRLRLKDELVATARGRLNAVAAGSLSSVEPDSGGVLGSSLVDEAIKTTIVFVRGLNKEALECGREGESRSVRAVLESSLLGSISALELLRSEAEDA